MKITVIFAPLFDRETGTRESVIKVEPGTSVGDLVRMLASKYGGAFTKVLPPAGEPPSILLLHNNQVRLDMSESLGDGDHIGFAIPLSGG